MIVDRHFIYLRGLCEYVWLAYIQSITTKIKANKELELCEKRRNV